MSAGITGAGAGAGLTRDQFIQQLTDQDVSRSAAERAADRIDGRLDGADGVISRAEIQDDYRRLQPELEANPDRFRTVNVNFGSGPSEAAFARRNEGPTADANPLRAAAGQLMTDLFANNGEPIAKDEFLGAAIQKFQQVGLPEADAAAIAEQLYSAALRGQADGAPVTREMISEALSTFAWPSLQPPPAA